MKISAQARALGRIPAIANLLDVVCRTTGLPLAIVAQVDEERWTACCVQDEVGFNIEPGAILPTQVTPCFEVLERERPVVINDRESDPGHASNPVMQAGQFRSYISAPIILADGRFFGTLCALGQTPAKLDTPELIGMFKLFAGLVATQIDHAAEAEVSAEKLRDAASRFDFSETGRHSAETKLAASSASLITATTQLAISDAALIDAQATAELREQFVGILGHDLRNPISSIGAGITLLCKSPQSERDTKILTIMEQSTARMAELVRNMLDFAVTQLGGGIQLDRRPSNLEAVLSHVVQELHAKKPDRQIEADFRVEGQVECDPSRIGQLLSNLLANALTHGAADQPVKVAAFTDNRIFELSVVNYGPPIPPEARESLFRPYVRGKKNNVEGLGLGLYICASVAKAHGGELVATSTPAETRFTFTMPY